MPQTTELNPNDAKRQQILQYFYDRNAVATSHYGKRGSAVKISDLKRELKLLHGMKQNEVVANLNYLLDRGWIKRREVEKTVVVKGGTVPSTVVWYEITARGIDRIEGESTFRVQERYPGINITATGSNLITVGDGNVVNAELSNLDRALTDLRNMFGAATNLSESQKLDACVDIESIRDQLARSEPNRSVVHLLWAGVEKVATAAGFIDAVSKVEALISAVAEG